MIVSTPGEGEPGYDEDREDARAKAKLGMARADEWFRNDRWDAAEEAAFFARLGRRRKAALTSQYGRIKAALLEATGDPPKVRGAIEILRRVLLKGRVDSDLALCTWQIARCHLILGDLDAALKELQLTLRREEQFPRWLTGAWSDFAQLVVSRKLREHYGEVLSLLRAREKVLLFPADRFIAHASRSLIAWENGSKAVAREEADKALAEVERPHEHKGLARGYDDLVARLRKIAR
jgi:hypothetical protein